MGSAQYSATEPGDNLGRLLALLEAARAEEARRRVDPRAGWRALLVAVEGTDSAVRAA